MASTRSTAPGEWTMPVQATVDEMDLTVACPVCGADKTDPCRGLPARAVHLPQRRAKWLLETQQARIAGDLVIIGPPEGSRYAPN